MNELVRSRSELRETYAAHSRAALLSKLFLGATAKRVLFHRRINSSLFGNSWIALTESHFREQADFFSSRIKNDQPPRAGDSFFAGGCEPLNRSAAIRSAIESLLELYEHREEISTSLSNKRTSDSLHGAIDYRRVLDQLVLRANSTRITDSLAVVSREQKLTSEASEHGRYDTINVTCPRNLVKAIDDLRQSGESRSALARVLVSDGLHELDRRLDSEASEELFTEFEGSLNEFDRANTQGWILYLERKTRNKAALIARESGRSVANVCALAVAQAVRVLRADLAMRLRRT